ncbi:hypothetical protein K443DRAFT_14682 [Laccaria amethystina LaAM-08-1]|uniref:Uncharacterized protein n=1 Tax=Laccaria amethystina LaAM-08-1 TaxID=1095629 RepID=A0A0C9X3J0_9AGAR|nr:hypothetical protein K443DRAFT_14682 [Laccaria amethystina LaAM-08-1]
MNGHHLAINAKDQFDRTINPSASHITSTLHRSRNLGSSSVRTPLTRTYETDEERTERILSWDEDQAETFTTSATSGSVISTTSFNGPQHTVDDNGNALIGTTIVDGRSANFTSNSRTSTLTSPTLDVIQPILPPAIQPPLPID